MENLATPGGNARPDLILYSLLPLALTPLGDLVINTILLVVIVHLQALSLLLRVENIGNLFPPNPNITEVLQYLLKVLLIVLLVINLKPPRLVTPLNPLSPGIVIIGMKYYNVPAPIPVFIVVMLTTQSSLVPLNITLYPNIPLLKVPLDTCQPPQTEVPPNTLGKGRAKEREQANLIAPGMVRVRVRVVKFVLVSRL